MIGLSWFCWILLRSEVEVGERMMGVTPEPRFPASSACGILLVLITYQKAAKYVIRTSLFLIIFKNVLSF